MSDRLIPLGLLMATTFASSLVLVYWLLHSVTIP